MLVTSKRVAACEDLGPKGSEGGPRLVADMSDRERKRDQTRCGAVKTMGRRMDFIPSAVGSP